MELTDSKQCKYVLVNLVNYIIILMCFACACWTLSVDWRRQLSTVYILNKLWLVDKTIQNSDLIPLEWRKPGVERYGWKAIRKRRVLSQHAG